MRPVLPGAALLKSTSSARGNVLPVVSTKVGSTVPGAHVTLSLLRWKLCREVDVGSIQFAT